MAFSEYMNFNVFNVWTLMFSRFKYENIFILQKIWREKITLQWNWSTKVGGLFLQCHINFKLESTKVIWSYVNLGMNLILEYLRNIRQIRPSTAVTMQIPATSIPYSQLDKAEKERKNVNYSIKNICRVFQQIQGTKIA